jgi:hypothetical protein
MICTRKYTYLCQVCCQMKKPPIPPRPEARTVVLSIKVRKSTGAALEKAAKAADRSKASVLEFVLEQWLKENGFLK